MPTSQRPPACTPTFFLLIAALWSIGLWALLQPARSVAQQVETPTTTPPTSTTVVTDTITGTAIATMTVTTRTPTPEIFINTETPTPGVTVVTPTPEPPNVFAAATHSIELTEQAALEGTPTPLPRHIRIATRTPTRAS